MAYARDKINCKNTSENFVRKISMVIVLGFAGEHDTLILEINQK